jgi:hypothetical protein
MEGPILQPDQAYILRAAAIDACELIVQVSRSLDKNDKAVPEWMNGITLSSFHMWARAIASNRPDYKDLQIFVQRNTAFF